MKRKCECCGEDITDLNQHPYAHRCSVCRYVEKKVFCIVDKYRPMIEAHLNEHGWPHYGSGLKIVRAYPDILSGCPEIKTQKRKQQIIAACIKDLRKADGMRYVTYNTQVDVLTEADL